MVREEERRVEEGKVREGVAESRSAREKEQMCVDCGGVRSPS